MSLHLTCASLRWLACALVRMLDSRVPARPLDPVERLRHDGAGESVMIEFSRLGW